MINVLHTSDWHLGKKLYKFDRSEEHQLFLNWLQQTVRKEKIDLLIVAGDIFDSPNPPNTAQKMFYDFVFSLEEFSELTTVIIAGNHDSASLLDIPKFFFQKVKCHIIPYLNQDLSENELILNIKDKNIGLKLLPYFRNFELLNLAGDQPVKEFFHNFFTHWNSTQKLDRKILVSHHGFGKYSASGSEHAIYLSGLEYFPLEWVAPYFDYCALGHIHKKQALQQHIIYPGSPIPLRFSESNQKYVSLCRFDDTENHQKFLEIPLFRKLIRVKADQTTYLKALSKEIENLEDQDLTAYLEIEITMTEATAGIADNIRQFIQKKNLELVSFRPIFDLDSKASETSQENINDLDIFDLFEDYYKSKFPETIQLPEIIQEEFKALVEQARNAHP